MPFPSPATVAWSADFLFQAVLSFDPEGLKFKLILTQIRCLIVAEVKIETLLTEADRLQPVSDHVGRERVLVRLCRDHNIQWLLMTSSSNW